MVEPALHQATGAQVAPEGAKNIARAHARVLVEAGVLYGEEGLAQLDGNSREGYRHPAFLKKLGDETAVPGIDAGDGAGAIVSQVFELGEVVEIGKSGSRAAPEDQSDHG
jgi:hypothetical protein